MRRVFLGPCLSAATYLSTLVAGGCGSEPVRGMEEKTLAQDAKVVVGVLVGNLDESRNIYVRAFDALPTGELDLGSFQELADGALHLYDGMVLHANWETKSLVRYDVAADGTLAERGSLTLLNFGIPYLNTKPIVFSEERAYYVDNFNGRLIVFRPATMEILQTLEAPELIDAELTTYFGTPRKVGSRFLAPFKRVNEDYTATTPWLGVAIFQDSATEPVKIVKDERCGGGHVAFRDEKEDLYVMGDNGGGYFDFVAKQSLPAACVLRIKKDQSAFDPDYYVNLYELTRSPAVQGLWHLQGRELALQAWAPELPRERIMSEDDYWLGENLDWLLVDVETRQVRPLVGLPRSAPYSIVEFRIDAQPYLQRFLPSEQAGVAELYALRDGRAERVLQTSGEFWALGRVQATAAR